ncbi:hypothetical protein GGR50DRAFT_652160 [Xylaria sp. CBS 124048]|nr:hypothetical protein GGR50DRAFT_652160 [Xylaria sp. CBS 124048]
MPPWIPRYHLFEIDDQPWFPSFLRGYVQSGLTHLWTTCLPLLQRCSPATLVASILQRELKKAVSSYTYIDFCAGAGGPTPQIEKSLNWDLSSQSSSSSPDGVKFVLTDLHPHVESWKQAASKSAHLTYVPMPVDAAAAPPDLIEKNKADGKGVFRLFNLAFHHFQDDLARAMLKNTVETSDGFGIFELQSRTFSSFVSCSLFGVFIFLIAPFLYWWSPQVLFFIYIVPVVPFVLVFDGLVSSLRTRTADEVELLLRTCGAADTSDWVVRSGSETFLWPSGHLTWVIGIKQSHLNTSS